MGRLVRKQNDANGDARCETRDENIVHSDNTRAVPHHRTYPNHIVGRTIRRGL
jgi:hypothetical protein